VIEPSGGTIHARAGVGGSSRLAAVGVSLDLARFDVDEVNKVISL
jgi:hypothetical protein